MKINITSKDKKYEFSIFRSEINTVKDIKNYISNIINTENIILYHNESILNETDSLEIETLEMNIVFEVVNDIISEEGSPLEIPMNEIKTTDYQKELVKVRMLKSCDIIYVKPSQIIKKNEKTYLVKERMRIYGLDWVIDGLKGIKVSREDILKMIALLALLFTNNGEIVFILAGIFVLQLVSKLYIKHNKYHSRTLEHFTRTCLMFTASMFMIDHSRF